MTVKAIVTLRSGNVTGVGRDRIRPPQAVARGGSITVGAKGFRLTGEAAWASFDAVTNLSGRARPACALLDAAHVIIAID